MTRNKSTKSIGDLKHDPANARVHTPRGVGTIERSINRDGFGRSILLAADDTIIAGNATIDAAAAAGLENVRIIETTGDEVIALKRTDVQPGTPAFANLAIADNRAAEHGSFDRDTLDAMVEAGQIDPDEFWFPDEFEAIGGTAVDDDPGEPLHSADMESPSDGYKEQYGVIVMCDDDTEQARVYEALNKQGYNCRVVVT